MCIPQTVLRIIIVKRIGITGTDNKLVSKIIPKCGFRQFALERRIYFRQIYIINVQQLENMARLHIAPLLPDIIPSCRENGPFELRTRLHAVAHLQFGRCTNLTTEIFMQEREQETGKQNRCFRTEFPKVVSFRLAAGQRLVCTAYFSRKTSEPEQVSVLIIQTGSKSKIPCRVRPFQIDPKTLQFCGEVKIVQLSFIVSFSSTSENGYLHYAKHAAWQTKNRSAPPSARYTSVPA